MSDPYTVRPYDPGDQGAFLDLFERVLDGLMTPAWFAWKYEDNPYVDHVPIVVADHEGDLVGARSFFPLAVAAGTDRYEAFQPCDTMVHPDHQRRGLFTRMTERAIERYDDVDFFFNFPNHRSLPANIDLGWRVVGTRETYYRIQNPAAWLPGLGPLEGVARSLAGGYLSIRDRLASAGDCELAHYEGVPASLLTDLADRVPQFHVVRDDTFYGWRFESPQRTYRTVVARDDGGTVAAVVYSRRTGDRPTTVRLVEVLPLDPGSPGRSDALAACIDEVLRANPDAGVFSASGDAIPRPVLEERGFHSDRHVPLQWVTSASTQVVRPSGPEPTSWRRSGQDLADATNWRLAGCEIDSE